MGAYDCAVIGGGLVGAALAYGLAGAGLKTAILDEGDAALRASRGNFGLVWVQGKGKGRPEYARWSRRASEAWGDFAAELKEATGVDVAHSRKGGVLLALSEGEWQANLELLETLRREAGSNGYDYEVLERGRLEALLPGVGPEVVGGTYCPYDGHADPLKLLRALHAGFQGRGGRYLAQHGVDSIAPADGGFRLRTGGGIVEAEKVVLAAGLGNAALGPQVGLHLPVAPLQGQIMVTERTRPLFDLPTNLVRQTGEGTFLLGFSEEDVGFETATRAETLRDIAWRCSKAFPFLSRLRVVRCWAALRVMTPDGFPIYDASRSHAGAYAVTCHSGVTLAVNHAHEVAGWIAADRLPAEVACFSAGRFDVQAPA